MVAEIIEENQCRECERKIRGWQYRVIRLCKRCYEERFPVREISLPPLRRRVAGGWQKCLGYDEIRALTGWIDEIIERLDREQQD